MLSSNWSDAREILCVRLDTLGDVIMMEPAIRALKRAAKHRRITLLTSASGAQGARLMESVDHTLVYAAPWMKASQHLTGGIRDRRFAQQLRNAGFDGAVIFTCFSQSALPAAMLCYLAEIPRRLAYCRENPYQLLTDWAREPEPQDGIRHEVRRQLDLVSRIAELPADDRIQLRITPSMQQAVLRKLQRAGVDLARGWIVVHTGATAASRRWPPESFAQAADILIDETDTQIVFTGSNTDRQLVRYVRNRMKNQSHTLVGRLNVPQLAALLSLAPLLISNNTGPVHLAAGVGTPVVDIYALTNPQHTPWKVPSRVLSADVPCKYCFRSTCPEGHQQCLRGVTPREVVNAAIDLVNEARSTPKTASIAC